jgi:serine/threonine protein kinase
LGATLHHLLTRRDPRLEPPFSFSERAISQINPNCGPKLMQVVEKALQYSPADRYQSDPEMKDALMTVAKQSGVLVQPPSVKSASTQAPIEKNTVWEFACEDEIRGSPTYANGIIYIGSYDNNLYALDSDTGQFVWKYPRMEGLSASQPSMKTQCISDPKTNACMWFPPAMAKSPGLITRMARCAPHPISQKGMYLLAPMTAICTR